MLQAGPGKHCVRGRRVEQQRITSSDCNCTSHWTDCQNINERNSATVQVSGSKIPTMAWTCMISLQITCSFINTAPKQLFSPAASTNLSISNRINNHSITITTAKAKLTLWYLDTSSSRQKTPTPWIIHSCYLSLLLRLPSVFSSRLQLKDCQGEAVDILSPSTNHATPGKSIP